MSESKEAIKEEAIQENLSTDEFGNHFLTLTRQALINRLIPPVLSTHLPDLNYEYIQEKGSLPEVLSFTTANGRHYEFCENDLLIFQYADLISWRITEPGEPIIVVKEVIDRRQKRLDWLAMKVKEIWECFPPAFLRSDRVKLNKNLINFKKQKWCEDGPEYGIEIPDTPHDWVNVIGKNLPGRRWYDVADSSADLLPLAYLIVCEAQNDLSDYWAKLSNYGEYRVEIGFLVNCFSKKNERGQWEMETQPGGWPGVLLQDWRVFQDNFQVKVRLEYGGCRLDLSE